MKRYAHTPDGADCCSYMKPDPTGDFIRHDDADLAALVKAAEIVVRDWDAEGDVYFAVAWLRKQLAAVAGTTRGRDEP